MKPITRPNLASLLVLVLFLVSIVWSRSLPRQAPPGSPGQSSQVTIPSRPASALFKGEQGRQRSEIEFAPVSRTVTIRLRVEDPNGYFIPNIRRENFAVYEDGVRQKNATVEIEHAPVSIALLMEFGGRYHELNKVLGTEVPQAGRHLLEVIGREDGIAVFKYDTKLEILSDFSEGHEALDSVFDQLRTPEPSEANLYDALVETLKRIRGVTKRTAIIVVSSGIDTFSKANYQQVLQAAQDSPTPIYAIGLGRFLQGAAVVYGPTAPFARIDWGGAEKQLEMLARVSGGRAYLPEFDVEIPGIYDDIMENLRVRYVITYVSSNMATSGPPRQIRVELIDPRTGQPLRIHDSNGKVIAARVFVQESYSLDTASGG